MKRCLSMFCVLLILCLGVAGCGDKQPSLKGAGNANSGSGTADSGKQSKTPQQRSAVAKPQ